MNPWSVDMIADNLPEILHPCVPPDKHLYVFIGSIFWKPEQCTEILDQILPEHPGEDSDADRPQVDNAEEMSYAGDAGECLLVVSDKAHVPVVDGEGLVTIVIVC